MISESSIASFLPLIPETRNLRKFLVAAQIPGFLVAEQIPGFWTQWKKGYNGIFSDHDDTILGRWQNVTSELPPVRTIAGRN
jgi:hypothetical protein